MDAVRYKATCCVVYTDGLTRIVSSKREVTKYLADERNPEPASSTPCTDSMAHMFPVKTKLVADIGHGPTIGERVPGVPVCR